MVMVMKLECSFHLLCVCVFSFFSLATQNHAGAAAPSSVLPGYNLHSDREKEGAIDGGRSATAIDGAVQGEGWRRSLPPGLRNEKGAPLHRIIMNEGPVLYLLGSSHVSRASCDDVKLLLEHVRPDVLFVELCSQRVGLLLGPPSSESDEQLEHNKDQGGLTPLSQRGSLLFAKIQEDYAKKLNVTIGGEFRQAFQSALTQQRQFWECERQNPLWGKYERSSPSNPIAEQNSGVSRGNRPCAIVLGDRPVRITLLRAWESLRIFGKFKLMVALLWSSIHKPSEKELREFIESILNDRSGKNDLITTAMEDLGKSFPTLKRVIIEERDAFMVAKLRQTAELLMHSSDQDGERIIVALVGAGHCPGMLEHLRQNNAMRDEDETSYNSDTLDRMPGKILSGLIETKKQKVGNDAEIASLVHDIVQFDYSCVFQNENNHNAETIRAGA